MKKLILLLVIATTATAAFAQPNKEAKKKEQRTDNEIFRDRSANTNQGQTISEVNAWYNERKEAIKNDPNLTKAQKRAMRKELVEQKNARIHAINGGNANGKDDNEYKKDKSNKGILKSQEKSTEKAGKKNKPAKAGKGKNGK